MSEEERATKRVREVWSQPAERRMTVWTEHPLILRERHNRLVSGHPDRDCHQWFIEFARNFGLTLPVSNCLTLGCGFGEMERGYSQYSFAAIHDGVDIADGAVETARETARIEGLNHIRYWSTNLNKAILPEAHYDVVLAHQSIHHIEQLEHLAAQILRTLKPGGLFMLNEYIGLNRLQVAPDQKEFGSGLLRLLPERYVREPDGTLRRHMKISTAEEVATHDPSEAVRSEDIVDVLSETLDLLERRDYGGNILHMGLHNIVGNFATGDPRDEAWLRWLFDAEDRLLGEDGVTSDFTVMIFRRPS